MRERPLGELLDRTPDPRAVDEVWDRIEGRRNAFAARRRWALPALVVGAFAVLVGWRVLRPDPVPIASSLRLASGSELTSAALASPTALREIGLEDGSRLLVAPGARLAPLANDATSIVWALPQGSVTFDVMPHGPRTWVIDAGIAKVTVLGTRFTVQHDGDHVRVEVERGLVLVQSAYLPLGQRRLGPGDRVDLSATALELVVPDAPAALAEAPRSRKAAPAPSRSSVLYTQVAEAAAEVQPPDSAERLLAMADEARLSGHPEEAVAPLERLLAAHATDSRASTAAFTLGKIQLDTRKAPVAAAAAFERAIALGLPHALREDAYARRVEAYAQAGRIAQARGARAAYDLEYPEGRHRSGVASWAP